MEKKIKILHAITRLDKGGSSENTLISAMGLVEKGYEVDLLYGHTEDPDEDLIARAKESGVKLIYQDDLVRNIHPVRDIIAFFKIFGFMRRNRYDIVHAHSSKAGLICRVAAKLAGVKKIVYTPHGHVFYGYFGSRMTHLIISAEKMIARITDRIVGLTYAECREWFSFGVGSKEIYTAIPSGVEFEAVERKSLEGKDWKKELGVPADRVLIGSIGRFIDIKGFDHFIEAALRIIKERGDVYFVLAGDGPLRGKYEEMVASEGVKKRFMFVPWQENAGAFINALDIFVLPSLNEGMGRVLVQAMFFEKPVIATRVGGVTSVISDGAGIMIEPASSEDIVKAIVTILEDPEEARTMAEYGRDRVLVDYSANTMIEKLDKLYKELINE